MPEGYLKMVNRQLVQAFCGPARMVVGQWITKYAGCHWKFFRAGIQLSLIHRDS